MLWWGRCAVPRLGMHLCMLTASIFPTACVNKIRYFFLLTIKRTIKNHKIHGYSQVTV